MKKKILLMSMTMVLLTGCKVIDLTDTQNALIGAEIGRLLMKYDISYNESLIPEGELNQMVDEIKQSSTDTSTTDNNTTNGNNNATSESNNNTSATKKYTNNIGKTSKYTFKYMKKYKVAAEFQHKSGGTSATSGNTFLIANVRIVNNTNKKINIDYYTGNKPQFVLTINGSETFNSFNSIVPACLSTFIDSIEAKGKANGVLLFEIPKSLGNKIKTAEISMTLDGTTNTAKLK